MCIGVGTVFGSFPGRVFGRDRGLALEPVWATSQAPGSVRNWPRLRDHYLATQPCNATVRYKRLAPKSGPLGGSSFGPTLGFESTPPVGSGMRSGFV